VWLALHPRPARSWPDPLAPGASWQPRAAGQHHTAAAHNARMRRLSHKSVGLSHHTGAGAATLGPGYQEYRSPAPLPRPLAMPARPPVPPPRGFEGTESHGRMDHPNERLRPWLTLRCCADPRSSSATRTGSGPRHARSRFSKEPKSRSNPGRFAYHDATDEPRARAGDRCPVLPSSHGRLACAFSLGSN
jgi:hypothetical protein